MKVYFSKMMKTPAAAVAVWTVAAFTALARPTAAVDCGKWFSNDCLGEEDIRYDSHASINIEDQAAVWSKLSGLFVVETTDYDREGNKQGPTFYDPTNPIRGRPYPRDQYVQFWNITNNGSRQTHHFIDVFRPAALDTFCSTPPPPATNLQTVVAPGECGVNGFSSPLDLYFTSSHEKDGSLLSLPFDGFVGSGSVPSSEVLFDYRAYPTSDAGYSAARADDFVHVSVSVVCLDPVCNQVSQQIDFYVPAGADGHLVAAGFRRSLAQRIATADEYIQQIEEAYVTNNVPVSQQVPSQMTMACLQAEVGGSCPTEQDWCEQDPACTESPYQEPEGTVKGGVIAALVIFFALLTLGIVLVMYQRRLRQQQERFRHRFARRVAETITVTGSTRQLTPDGLAEEFKRIDKDKGGTISREDLWQFLCTGYAGEMNESDFNALFAAIDLNDSGSVDFMEFCTFMGKCHDEFENVKNRKSVLMMRPSMAERSASILASLVTIDESKLEEFQAVGPVEEEGEKVGKQEDA